MNFIYNYCYCGKYEKYICCFFGVAWSKAYQINLAGMYISWLLLLKQMKIESRYADKICSLFKQNDCNNVLESEGAKLFGVIGWSEIGFGYFSVNVLLLLFSPALVTVIALINIFTLPYTLWSVWYQHSKANSGALKKQPFYEVSDCESIIRFGNINSKLQLTILSNPYCNPCAVMHKNIETLLKKVNNGIYVQYILSSFNEDLNSTNKYFIAACLSGNTVFSMQIFNDWFEKGKELKDDYFKKLSLKMDNPEIEIEFLKHESWKDKTQIRATPTVLVNGYQLPENYKIEDLRYFIDLDLRL
jgi:hypothetical protein